MLELRRLGTALMAAGLVIAGCGGDAGDATEGEAPADTIVVEEEGDLEEAIEETGEAIGEGAEEVGEGAQEVGEAIGEGAEEIGDKAEDAADAVD